MGTEKISSAVIDTNNNKVIPFTDGLIRVVSDSLFIVGKGQQLVYWGVYDRNQKEIIPIECEQIGMISDSLFKVKKNGFFAIFDSKGNQVQSHKYSSIGEFKEDLAKVTGEKGGEG